MSGRYNSHRQLVDCLAHRVVEIVQLLPVQSPLEGRTDVGAGQPEFDVVHLVGHLVLGAFQSTIGEQKARRLTLTIVRMTTTEPKAALAGVILEASLARFKPSMVTFNTETMLPRPLGRWDSTFMVKTRGGGERTVRRAGRKEGLGP